MKSNYKSKIIQKSDVENAVQEEWNSKLDQLYEDVTNDVTAQLMATVFCYLNIRYHWTGKTLNSIKEGIEDLFILMQRDGIAGKPFNTDNCIEYMRSLGVEFEDRRNNNEFGDS